MKQLIDYGELSNKARDSKMDCPDYDKHRWTDENVKIYMDSISELDGTPTSICQSRKIFFTEERGDVLQNYHLINCVTWYKKCGFISKDNIEKLFAFETPVLRLRIMEETEPHSGNFVEREFDLVKLAQNRGDATLLQMIRNAMTF